MPFVSIFIFPSREQNLALAIRMGYEGRKQLTGGRDIFDRLTLNNCFITSCRTLYDTPDRIGIVRFLWSILRYTVEHLDRCDGGRISTKLTERNSYKSKLRQEGSFILFFILICSIEVLGGQKS